MTAPVRTCSRCGEMQQKIRNRWTRLVVPSHAPPPHRHLWQPPLTPKEQSE